MNTEELKMVLEAIASLGESGKEAFIWWLALKYGAELLTSLMMLSAALGIPFLLLRFARHISRRNAALVEIGKEVEIDFWYWSEGEPERHSASDVVSAVKNKLRSS